MMLVSQSVLPVLCAIQLAYGQDSELTIIVIDQSPPKIFHFGLVSGNVKTVPISKSKILHPFAIDYDPETKDIYWTDVKLFEIRATHISGKNDRVLQSLRNRSAILVGLAVDVTAKKVFYTDEGNDVIAVLDMNGTNSEVIIDSGLEKPRAIVLHEEIRKLYWTDMGLSPYIATANYDGTEIRKIVTSGLGWPNRLALDKQNNILFWCDAKRHAIESVNVDGTHRRLIRSEPLALYSDISFSHGTLFFTDWKRGVVLNIPVDGGSLGISSPRFFNKLGGIHVYSNTDVSACHVGKYGSQCEECGHCKDNSACERITGICLAGCKLGYKGRYCKQECSAGTYGDKCHSVCGNCAGGKCSISSCLNGCTPGWQGIDCKIACPSSSYGSSCVPCGQCANDDVCNQLSGYCPSGCQAGWRGNRCDTACHVGKYGSQCEECGHCKDNSACERITGICLAGCKLGYKGRYCKQECSAGTYGDKCHSVCGNCTGGKCSISDGRCLNGCTPGWQGIDCKIACPSSSYGSSCVPCGQCANDDVCNQLSGYCPSGCQSGWRGNRCDTALTEQDVSHQNADERNHGLSLVVVVGAVAGGVVVLLIVVVIVVIVVVVLLRGKKNSRCQTNPEREHTSLDVLRQSNIYSMPTDSPQAFSSTAHVQSTSFGDDYSDLMEIREYVASPKYETLGGVRPDYLTCCEDIEYERPSFMTTEDGLIQQNACQDHFPRHQQ